MSAADLGDPNAPSPASLARRFGAPREATVPMLETVRVTVPDLRRRAVLEKTRGRLVFTALGFAVLFTLVLGKLADKTLIHRAEPKHEAAFQMPPLNADGGAAGTLAATPISTLATPTGRAKIVDRNGEELAISLPMAELYANPKEMIDQADAAHRIKQALPRLDEADLRARLTSDKKFVYLARQLTPREELAVNDLGIPGVYFMPSEHRDYPFRNVAAQVLGGVDVDSRGVAGVEKFFDQRLHDNPEPLRLSLDVHVQAVVRDELSKAMTEFRAIGACGIVMDVRTGEVLAMVSLPDYDANKFGQAAKDERFNRAATGMYEPGSTFKLQTAAMALDYGTAQIWSEFDASQPIKIGRFTITDFEGKHRWLYLPEVLAYSSNLGAAHIAMTVGAERQRAWLERMGMLGRLGIELPEAGRPLAPPVANWGEAAVMTIGFGHGIAVSPLHVVRGTAAVANGGILLRPTLLALPRDSKPQGERVMASATSDIVRKLMRLVVTAGYGKAAEVPGYFVGGKTGTAEKVGHGVYRKHANVSAFISVFPMNAPRYAVYMMLDEPQADASTHGYTTAGWVSAPAAGRVIARIGPLLGLLPQTTGAAEIEASLAIPLQPGHPPGARTIPAVAEPPPKPGAAPRIAEDPARKIRPKQPAVIAPVSAAPAAPTENTVPRDLRHEAMYRTSGAQADGVAAH